MKSIKLPFDLKADSKSQVNNLQVALRELHFTIDEKEFASRKIAASSLEAIKTIQKENKLAPNGNLTGETLKAINNELHHQFIAKNKYRTADLHSLLEKLGLKVDAAEKEQ